MCFGAVGFKLGAHSGGRCGEGFGFQTLSLHLDSFLKLIARANAHGGASGLLYSPILQHPPSSSPLCTHPSSYYVDGALSDREQPLGWQTKGQCEVLVWKASDTAVPFARQVVSNLQMKLKKDPTHLSADRSLKRLLMIDQGVIFGKYVGRSLKN